MNPHTGEIVQVSEERALAAGLIPLTASEHNFLIGREQKERIRLLKAMRKKGIQAAKRKLGRRLTADEAKAAVSGFELVSA